MYKKIILPVIILLIIILTMFYFRSVDINNLIQPFSSVLILTLYKEIIKSAHANNVSNKYMILKNKILSEGVE